MSQLAATPTRAGAVRHIDPAIALVAVGAVVVLGALVWRGGSIMAGVEHNSDLAAPLVMGDIAHRYPDAQLVTGRLGWWGGLWVVQLLRPLPGGLTVAAWLPLAATIAARAGVAWQARRAWSPLAAAVVLAASLAVGPNTWTYLAAWSARSPSWWAMALAGVAAVAATRAASSLEPR